MTAQEMARLWESRAGNFGGSAKDEFRAIGALALRISEKLMTEEIYSKPEDTWPSGKPKWRRTHRLAAHEKLRFQAGGTEAVITNDTPYAEPRHEANKPGRRQISLYRTAHWRDDMLDIMGREIPARLIRLQLQIARRT